MQAPHFHVHHNPFIVIWEVTRSCDLVCKHCRADAFQEADPQQLSTAEGKALLRHVREAFGPVLMVMTGGDPLKRPDVYELINYGHDLGLRMTITPSATPLLTPEVVDKLKAHGIQRMAISIDGKDATTHDAFRGFAGTFARSCQMLEHAQNIGLETQINTSINKHNQDQLNDIAQLAGWYGITLWSVFITVPTGRADADSLMSAGEHEKIYRKLAAMALNPDTSFDIKTTAGQPYYRVKKQWEAKQIQDTRKKGPSSLRAAGKINDGKGIVFISHVGDINPSGFLPIHCGNVREDSLADVYREHDLFVCLREPRYYDGKCSVCDFNDVCGGSRSRTYALTGDPLASDPTCPYHPPALRSENWIKVD